MKYIKAILQVDGKNINEFELPVRMPTDEEMNKSITPEQIQALEDAEDDLLLNQ